MTAEPLLQEVQSARRFYLHPGQMFTGPEPTLVTTVLGSCVAICLWDPKTKVAGINHFLLAHNPLRGNDDARYGNTACDRLLVAMWKRGASVERMTARIFGGACVLHGPGPERNAIGAQNAEVARQFLLRHRINIAADETGGTRGRKLLFDTGTGSAWLKEI
ncbi:MAG TPA: chemotaxis protein CheD [Thermoanaerobaculia bacterium]|nr:chemotaxis protein CheD [Thermoanaerobaculia bacterium]